VQLSLYHEFDILTAFIVNTESSSCQWQHSNKFKCLTYPNIQGLQLVVQWGGKVNIITAFSLLKSLTSFDR
jgi:hypothetical protein